jgi:hypothetical protein
MPEEVVESGGHGGSRCSACYCCFPRTPEGFVSLDDFEVAPATEEILYDVPHHEWLMLTDLEAVAMDAAGNELRDVRLVLFREDMMGMRTRVRWANCSVYHSPRGFAIQPGSKLVMVIQGARAPAEYYWQLSGCLWPATPAAAGTSQRLSAKRSTFSLSPCGSVSVITSSSSAGRSYTMRVG